MKYYRGRFIRNNMKVSTTYTPTFVNNCMLTTGQKVGSRHSFLIALSFLIYLATYRTDFTNYVVIKNNELMSWFLLRSNLHENIIITFITTFVNYDIFVILRKNIIRQLNVVNFKFWCKFCERLQSVQR